MDRFSSLFFPSYHATTRNRTNPAFWFMLAVLAGLVLLAYGTIRFDQPFMISSYSRALYVDEGFYSDAAQNFAKFGQWGFYLDFPHWSSAPLLTFFQSLVFPLFGPSLETARMLSVIMSLVTALAFYSLLRMGLPPVSSMMLTVSGILTFNFAAFSRSAFTDPTATCLALLGFLAFARVRARELAIPLSIGFALLSFLSKLYFLFTFAVMVALWVIELLIVPWYQKKEIQTKPLTYLGISVTVSVLLYMLFLYRFGERLAEQIAINSWTIPYFDLEYVWGKTVTAIYALPYDTKAQAYLWTIGISASVCSVLLLWPRQRAALISRASHLTRAELALCLWLFVGLLGVGVGGIIRPHYHFFAILPIVLSAAVALKLALPPRLQTPTICAIAALHILFQWPYYVQWAHRAHKTAVYDASREIVRLIHEQSGDEAMIPVIGEYASQLGLYSERVFTLDAKWSPMYPLCLRVIHYKPRFHVDVEWPNSPSHRERKRIEACHGVKEIRVIKRIRVFNADELVLARIYYEN